MLSESSGGIRPRVSLPINIIRKENPKGRRLDVLACSPRVERSLRNSWDSFDESAHFSLSSVKPYYECYEGIAPERIKERIDSLQDLQESVDRALQRGPGEKLDRFLRELRSRAFDTEMYLTYIEALDTSHLSPESRLQEVVKRVARIRRGCFPLDNVVEFREISFHSSLNTPVRLEPEHWLEWMDPMNRPFGTLPHKLLVDKWKTEYSDKMSFFRWLETLPRTALPSSGKVAPSIPSSLHVDDLQVEYLFSSKSRERYRLKALDVEEKILLAQKNESGVLRPFDTTGMTSIQSGMGRAIYVLGPDSEPYFFAGPHHWGRFHHSSFFAGGHVSAAGDLLVRDGCLEAISNYSGHYKPDWRGPSIVLLAKLEDMEVDLKGVELNLVTEIEVQHQVELKGRTESVISKVRAQATFDAQEFLDSDGDCIPLKSAAGPVQGRLRQDVLDLLQEAAKAGELEADSEVRIREVNGVTAQMQPWSPSDQIHTYNAQVFLAREGKDCRPTASTKVPNPLHSEEIESDALPGAYIFEMDEDWV